MIPVGYMAKRITIRPEWLKAERVEDIYSVSSCMSNDFADYSTFWKHNGYWFFDSPEIIKEVSQQNSIELTKTVLFFYEVYELEFNSDKGEWVLILPDPAFTTDVAMPPEKRLEGYDVVTFGGSKAECSPLSCNSLATDVETNNHCLLASFEQAKQLIEKGKFKNTEPGNNRIFAVYSTEWF
jgi:hypothetical protein